VSQLNHREENKVDVYVFYYRRNTRIVRRRSECSH